MSARARRHRNLHLALAGVWAVLAVPSILWWNKSILWVIFISLYANIASHWAAAEASEPSE